MSQSFKPILNFDSITPQTTKGDLIGRTTIGATRIPIGVDSTVLTADSTQALGVKWAAASPNLGINTLSGATTLPATSQVILASGTTFAITLPSPTSNSGLFYKIIKTDGLLTPISITGTGFVGVTLASQTEEYEITCDGTTFWISNHYAMTGWTNAGTVGFTATTTAPLKGTTSVDEVWWRRVGTNMEVRYAYKQTNATGASSGSGDYLILVPGVGSSIDSNRITFFGGAAIGNAFSAPTNIVGHCQFGTAINPAAFSVYDANRVRVIGTGAFSSALNGLNNATAYFAGFLSVPMSGWGA